MTGAVIVLGTLILVAVAVTVITRGGALAEVELRFSSPLPPERIRAEGFPQLLEVMAGEGYALVSVDGDEALFQRREVPRYAWYIGALLYPIGLLAFLRRRWIFARARVDGSGDGSSIVVSGMLTTRLRDELKASFG